MNTRALLASRLGRELSLRPVGLAVSALLVAAGCGSAKPSLTVGAGSSGAARVLAYIFADALKAEGYPATVRAGLVSPERSLSEGQVEVAVEHWRRAGNLEPVIARRAPSKVAQVLKRVAAGVTEADLQSFEHDVAVDRDDPAAVAAVYVEQHDL